MMPFTSDFFFLASGLATRVTSIRCYFPALMLYPRSYTTAMIWAAGVTETTAT